MPNALQSLLLIVGAYLLGSVAGWRLWLPSPVVGAGRGETTGARLAAPARKRGAAFVFDLAKGALAAWVGLHFAPATAPYASPTAHAYVAALAVAIGHAWPAWHRFRGATPAAPLAGAILVLWPWVTPVLLLAWGGTLLASGSPMLASTLAAVALVAAAWWSEATPPRLAFAVAAAVLVVVGERVALLRMVRGESPRFAAARLLLRLRRGPR